MARHAIPRAVAAAAARARARAPCRRFCHAANRSRMPPPRAAAMPCHAIRCYYAAPCLRAMPPLFAVVLPFAARHVAAAAAAPHTRRYRRARCLLPLSKCRRRARICHYAVLAANVATRRAPLYARIR